MPDQRQRNHRGYTKLRDGQLPKPARIKAVARRVEELYFEVQAVPSIPHALIGKSIGTVESYKQALALTQRAIDDLKSIETLLREALPPES